MFCGVLGFPRSAGFLGLLKHPNDMEVREAARFSSIMMLLSLSLSNMT
jgi:hypothetical protein